MPYDFYNEEKKEFQPTGGGVHQPSPLIDPGEGLLILELLRALICV